MHEDWVGISPVRLGNRTYRAWGTAKLTLMVRIASAPVETSQIRGNNDE